MTGHRANISGREWRMSEAGLREFYARTLDGQDYLIQK